jgi:D-alanine-D-alanine ligase-like ATP-grasp enzyme
VVKGADHRKRLPPFIAEKAWRVAAIIQMAGVGNGEAPYNRGCLPMFYPDHARYAKLASDELGVTFVDLDDGHGYLFKIVNRERALIIGAGRICSYPINNASSHGISRDKKHTKIALRERGLPTIEGRVFFASDEHVKLRSGGYEVHDSYIYAQDLGFPVFCKPNTGSKGDFAEVVTSLSDLERYALRVSRKYDSFLVEKLLMGTEYRVLVKDDSAVFYTGKRPPYIVGDGYRTPKQLLEEIDLQLQGTGVSSFPVSALLGCEQDIDAILPLGHKVTLCGRQNLSAHGAVDFVKMEVPHQLSDMAVEACGALGLRLGAVDFFDLSASKDLSDLVIIEVNGNPALKAVEDSGHLEVILSIWKSMIREMLEV